MKRMKGEVGKVQGIPLTLWIYHFLLLFTKSGAECSARMIDLRNLVIPVSSSLCSFVLLLSASLLCSLSGVTNFHRSPSPCSREQAVAGRSTHCSPCTLGTWVPACCTVGPGTGFLTSLQQFAVSDLLLSPCC